MCGIAGLVTPSPAARLALERMLARLAHRGPDDSGIWHDTDTRVWLGHRRLSIIDLSPAGHQPMLSASTRYALSYNGEIYNHLGIRSELERNGGAPAWRGNSDTETLLAAIEHWGLEPALHRCNGMFALALWDRRNRTLTLARDRMGEKPLYFGWVAGQFAFASELKAFAALPGWQPRLQPTAVAGYLRTGYVHGPVSAVAGIYRLPPGQWLTLAEEDICQPRDWPWLERRSKTYWSLARAAEAGARTSAEDALQTLEALLSEAVTLRMAADVPLGAFLSGGIDSSLVTALMQANSERPVRTFSIGFDDASHDEAPFARAVADHLGTEHTELYAGAQAALDLIPTLSERFDEPFADTSQLPTLLVSQLARQHVTVALSGDGGDELFGGYTRYVAITKLWRALQPLPPPLRRGSSIALKLAATLLAPLPAARRAAGPLSFRLRRLAERLAAGDPEAMRLSFIGGAGHGLLLRAPENSTEKLDIPSFGGDPLRQLMYGDQIDYLPDDILFKVDRAAMAFGLETRVPLLDHRIVELSWHLPTSALMRDNQGKQPLRSLLYRHVPAALIDRPKQGFAPPMDAWLRGPLREWAESRLSPTSVAELPMLDTRAVTTLWKAHCSGRMNAAYALWNVLMLADWRQHYGVAV